MRCVLLAAVAAACTSVGVAYGNVVATGNFDGVGPTYAYGYAYGGAGSMNGFAPGLGVGATTGWFVTADSSGGGMAPWWGFGGGAGWTAGQFNPLVAPVNASDFYYQFDVKLEGLLPSAAAFVDMNFELVFLAPDGTLNTDSNPDVLVRYQLGAAPLYNTALGGFQTIVGTFSGASIGEGSQANLDTFFGSVIQVQLNINNASGDRDFGRDTDNRMIFDNVFITQFQPIPEPGVVGLVGLAALGLLRRRP